ncbi:MULTISPECIES: nucleotidyltransferase domain-containing protein [unclassified Candidatus Frackibacter]|uniref:nucleotidyltransferase domain-containing protein n=1 Tax=unclassified Candidatus Frackibacter TaxID=2648818 RepID=UPI00088A317D|nr:MULTISPECIES: nucleotidyltransferase domain-containing protein [unclassified Candidatus Frackibacter]SDC42337.1 Predicted nucleotidyltransferase [Candidatus Frackibacter sp. WG11]SEM58815.1 Predicted nucleotidyltransferase [Candidatus Frackibacter sp. WG12]SFL63353.1 Predicted nucleotidyltransferase [Candidatus Frackibacter sp. WG13]
MAKNKAKINKKIDEYIETLEQNVTINKAILYGSWANGNPHEYSDIDLAIFSPDFGKNKLKELQLLSKIAWEVDSSIEAIPYSSDKLNTSDPTTFVYEILETGKTVYDRTSKH